MQILPSSQKEALGDHLFAMLGQTSEEGSSFADELLRHQQAQQAVDAGESHSVTAALAQNPTTVESSPLTQAPYSHNTSNGVTYSMEEVCFTKQDIQELAQKLEQAGAPPELLEGLKKLGQQPDGATLAQVVASLNPARENPQFSEKEMSTLKSLCGRMDSSGKLGEQVADLMGKGEGKQALAMLTQAIQDKGPDFRLTLEKDEAAVLAKGLNISNSAQKQLLGNFGPYQSLSLDSKDFQRFMAPALNDIVQRETKQEKLDKALGSTLQPILDKAKKRMETEKAAGELSNRRTEQSKALIQKTVLQEVNKTLENVQGQQADQQLGLRDVRTSAVRPEAADKASEKVADDPRAALNKDKAGNSIQGTGKEAQAVVTADTHKGARQQGQAEQQGNQNGPRGQNEQGANQGKDALQHNKGRDERNADFRTGNARDRDQSVWGQMLDKTEVRAPMAPTTATATASSLVGMAGAAGVSGLSAVNVAMENISAAQPGRQNAQLSRQMVNQVEQSMLTAMRDGTKRLELQLNQGELGNLTLMLSVRNGEVSATIRSEKGETAELLSRQMDMLRSQLEQQGVKVDKLEVQTQTPDNNTQQQWENMQQHNARQEEYARRDTLDRLRNLGKMRNNNENEEVVTLEQGVQLQRHTAGNAAQSLHIVA